MSARFASGHPVERQPLGDGAAFVQSRSRVFVELARVERGAARRAGRRRLEGDDVVALPRAAKEAHAVVDDDLDAARAVRVLVHVREVMQGLADRGADVDGDDRVEGVGAEGVEGRAGAEADEEGALVAPRGEGG